MKKSDAQIGTQTAELYLLSVTAFQPSNILTVAQENIQQKYS
jgi:hypothetical protein